MKRSRLSKMTAHLLSAVMLVSTLSIGLTSFGMQPAFADEDSGGDAGHASIVSGKAISAALKDGEYETEGSAYMPYDSKSTDSHIYLGTTDLKDGKYRATNYYRVLNKEKTNTGEDGIFLLSEYTASAAGTGSSNNHVQFNTSNDSSWQNSAAKSWCGTFLTTRFSTAEQGAFKAVTKAAEPETVFDRPTGGDTNANNIFHYSTSNLKTDALSNEKVFFLSAKELKDYFKSTRNGDRKNDLYGYLEDGLKARSGTGEGFTHWLLRSAYSSTNAGNVVDNGNVGYTTASYKGVAARPAFNLDLSSILFASTADDESKPALSKVSTKLTAPGTSENDDWKLTLVDTTRDTNFKADVYTTAGEGGAAASEEQKVAATTRNLNADGKYIVGDGTNDETNGVWTIPVHFEGATYGKTDGQTGTNYVSAAIIDAYGNVKAYNHISRDYAAKTVELTIPDGLTEGKYSLKIFSEVCENNTTTDLACNPTTITLTVGEHRGWEIPTAEHTQSYTGQDQCIAKPGEGWTLEKASGAADDISIATSNDEDKTEGWAYAKNAATNGEGVKARLKNDGDWWILADGTTSTEDQTIPYTILKNSLTAVYVAETVRCDGKVAPSEDGGEATAPQYNVKVYGFVNNEGPANADATETNISAAGYEAPTIANNDKPAAGDFRDAVSASADGTIALTPSGGKADNYAFNYQSANMTVSKHSVTKVDAKEGNCSDNGADAYWKCSVCNSCYSTDTATKDKYIDPNELVRHDWVEQPFATGAEGEDASTLSQHATCGSDGVLRYVCDNNNEHKKEVTIPATGHRDDIMTFHAEVAATCQTPGVEAYWVCNDCGKYFTRDATKMDEDNGFVELTKANGFPTDGPQAIPVLPENHRLTKTNAKAATCEQPGNLAYWTCSVCGQVYGDNNGEVDYDTTYQYAVDEEGSLNPALVTEAIGHDWGEWVKYSDTEDCSSNSEVRICKNNNSHREYKGGHPAEKVEAVAAKEATCTENGNIAYWHCGKCNKYFSDENLTTEVSSDGIVITGAHRWNINTTAEGTEDGWIWTGSEAAGYSSATVAIKCGVCNAEETVKASITKDTVAGTTTYTAKASKDDNEFVSTKVTVHGDSNHNWLVSSYKAPTTTEKGSVGYTCSICGETKTEEIAMLPSGGSSGGGGSGGGGGSTPATQYTATSVTAMITALPAADKLSSSDAAAVAAARSAYDSLTAEEKAKVDADVLKKLEAAEATLKADLTAVSKVETLIAELPEYTSATLADAEKAIVARDAYNALTDAQKAAVDKAYVYELKNTLNTLRVKSQTVNKATFTASDASLASELGATTMTLGAKVKKIKAGAFSGTDIKTLTVKTKKLTKSRVKGSLKGSSVTKIKVKVGNAKTNKKYVKKYKKIFTQKNAGKKVRVSR